MDRVLRVLVVDDSAYVRKVVREMLHRSPFLDVIGTARDGEEALEMVDRLRPDVVTSDLIMPGTDGVEFIRRQMAIRPLPIVVLSIAADSERQVMSALDAGAFDFLRKPTALASERIFEIADALVAKVKAAGGAAMTPTRTPLPSGVVASGSFRNEYDLIVIGVSTGGPQALKAVIPRLAADFPVPIAVVLHMPVGYTEAYAQRLDETSALHVIEAQEGDEVRPGVVFVAPAGRHLTFRRQRDGRVTTSLDVRPLDTPHRPSVDVMFRSAAEIYGDRVLALVMTGMGDDGCHGAAWIKARGGAVLTESEETCVVYGMPRSIVEAGLSDLSVPLHQLSEAIVARI